MTNELFKNRYRIPSARAPWHDYRHGIYFVTICTQKREHSFGKITHFDTKSPTMMLSDIGECADFCWQDIPTHFPHVQTLSRVIMPNHIHGILAINPVGGLEQTGTDDTTNNRFGPHSKNLASVVRGFKIGVTKFARQHNLPFKWQPRYHEHIIRNMDELYFITDYIENNVANWEKDKFYG